MAAGCLAGIWLLCCDVAEVSDPCAPNGSRGSSPARCARLCAGKSSSSVCRPYAKVDQPSCNAKRCPYQCNQRQLRSRHHTQQASRRLRHVDGCVLGCLSGVSASGQRGAADRSVSSCFRLSTGRQRTLKQSGKMTHKRCWAKAPPKALGAGLIHHRSFTTDAISH